MDYRDAYLGQWNFHTVRITQVLHTYPGQPPVVRDTIEYDYLGYVAASGLNEIEVNYREGIFKFYPIDSLGEFSVQTYYWDGGSFSDSTHVSFNMRYGGLGDWYEERVTGTR